MLRLIGYSALVDMAECEHIVVTFPAWRYQLDGDIASAFVAALSSQRNYPTIPARGEHQDVQGQLRWADVRKRCVEVLQALAGGLGTGTPLESAGKIISSQLGQGVNLDAYEDIQQSVGRLVEAILKERAGRLIVLVDDLDRCSPEAMVRLFEWMKLHFQSARCSFVVALDHRAAARAIVGRYRDYVADTRDVSFGYRYLDKLFDEHFELRSSPLVAPMAIRQSLRDASALESVVEHEGERPFARMARVVLGYDFPWQNRLDGIVAMRCVGEPRVMLRVADVYRDILSEMRGAINNPEGLRLPREAPFWILLLICMQFTLTPEALDNFAYRQGPLAYAAAEAKVHSTIQGLSGESPIREISDILVQLGAKEPLHLPRRDELLLMLSLVRQRVMRDG